MRGGEVGRARAQWSWIVLACVQLALCAAPGTARAQTTLLAGMGGPLGYGTDCLGPSDDGSSRAIDITTVFPGGLDFGGTTVTTMFVNTNGNVTFGGAYWSGDPSHFSIAFVGRMIAAYWADVDTRPPTVGTTVCGGLPDGGSTYAGDCLNPASDGIWWHLDPAGQRIVVTWDRVGYYRCHDTARMSFQMVLRRAGATCTGSPTYEVELRYAQCEWNAGDASGGTNGIATNADCTYDAGSGSYTCPLGATRTCTGSPPTCGSIPAVAGYFANGLSYYELPPSGRTGVHTALCTGSNVGEVGIWRFDIGMAASCTSSGASCAVSGERGACMAGRLACVSGSESCVAQSSPEIERCDNIDNDCDGVVDNGSDLALCGSGAICRAGVCVEPCSGGTCPGSLSCVTPGVCVTAGCESRICAENQRCSAGTCVDACDGVVCPDGWACAYGRCVDACTSITCERSCDVCEDGVCVENCTTGAPCASGLACDGASGRCVEPGCEGVSCAAGRLCVSGTCTDPCVRMSCPTWTRCELGACIPTTATMSGGGDAGTDAGGSDAGVDAGRTDAGASLDAGPASDAGGMTVDAGSEDAGAGETDGGTMTADAGATDDAGSLVTDAGGVTTDAGGGAPDAPSFDGGTGEAPDAGAPPAPTDGSCACHTAHRAGTPRVAGGLLLVLGLVASRRRRRIQ